MVNGLTGEERLSFLEVHLLLTPGTNELTYGGLDYTIAETDGMLQISNKKEWGDSAVIHYASSITISAGNTWSFGIPIANTTPKEFVEALRTNRIVVQTFNKNQFVLYEILPESHKFKRLIFDSMYSAQYECYRILGQSSLDKPQKLINMCVSALGLDNCRVVDKNIFEKGYTVL